MKVYLHSLGCKVNKYDTESLAERFRRAGFSLAETPEGADVYVINSCTVTAVADQKSRQAIRKFRRMSPDACVVLSGCMVQAYPDKAASLDEAAPTRRRPSTRPTSSPVSGTRKRSSTT